MTTDKGPVMMNLCNPDGTIAASMMVANAGEARTIGALLRLDHDLGKEVRVDAEAGLVTMTAPALTLIVRPAAMVVLKAPVTLDNFQATLDAAWALAKAEDHTTTEEG